MTILLVAPMEQGRDIVRVFESSCIEVIHYDEAMKAVSSLAVCTFSAAIFVISPGLDPYVVACAIRAVDTNSPIPIIVVSAADNPRLHRSLADFFGATRSINFRDIYGLADMILHRHIPVPLRLLLADDRDDIAIPFTRHLAPRYEVFHARNGVEACAEATRTPNQWDLIVLDNSMPKMTGLECLAKIRQQDLETPIVLHSAFADQQLVCDALAMGANDAWTKNLKAAIVRVRVDRVISRSLFTLRRGIYENA